MQDTFGPKKLRLVEHNPLVVALAALPLCLGFWVMSAGPRSSGMQFFSLAIVTALWAWRQKPWARYREMTVRAGPRGLELGKRLLPRAHIQGALVVPADGKKPTRVRVSSTGLRPPIEVAVDDVAEGRALLRALGRDVSQAAATFRVGSGISGNPLRMLGVGLAAAAVVLSIAAVASWLGVHAAFGATPFLGMVAVVALFVLPARLVVGADGIAHRWLFFRRFIDYADVSTVTRYRRGKEEGLSILLESNETVRIPIESGGISETGHAAAIEERVNEALDAWQRGGAVADEARLGRGERALSDWITALKAMGAGADAGPRQAPVPRDRLWRIVEDPRADHAARAAAAVALGGGEDEERARLRVVAEATAAPRLRVAIEAAAGQDEAAIGEALAAVEEEAKRRAAG
jgi:hypothetical protein